jgi:ganglioside GM2 activator
VGFFWIDVPCIDNVGSRDYEDLCADIPFPPGEPCPEPFLSLNLPCNCPVSKVSYTQHFILVEIRYHIIWYF